jgi:capsular polysaccharide biosynthesis protein/Mrp family chromosome partitioning ATPase
MNPIQRPDSFEAADYVGVLRRRWWIVLALTIFGLLGAFAYTVVAPKSYTSTANVSVQPTAADATNNTAANSRTSGSSVNLDTEAQVVVSTTVSTAAGKIMHSTLTPWRLSQNVSVTVPPNSSVLTIACQAPTANGAATCANAFATAYLQHRTDTASSVINTQLKAVQTKLGSLSQQATSLATKIGSLPANSPSRLSAQSQLTSVQKQADTLSTQEGVLQGDLGNVTGGAILTHATAPGKPTSPKKSLVLPSGIVAGLLLGLICAFVWDRRDKRIHTAKDAERLLDLPVMLNLPPRAFSQQLSVASPRSKTGQAFTELAYAVAASLGEGSHVVLVAGTTSGAGGSVVAANLAATLARTHSDVVLVCANMNNTVAPEMLGIEPGRGLAEVLAGKATVMDVARGPASVPGLWIIAPGADTSLATYQLQHDRVQALMAHLRRDARYIVIDALATEEGADTFALAEFADAALITVEIPRTTRTAAADCIRRLRHLRTPVLGTAVLSAVSSRAEVRPPRTGQPRVGSGEDEARHEGTTVGRGAREASALSAPIAGDRDGRDRWVRTREGHGDPAGRVPGN